MTKKNKTSKKFPENNPPHSTSGNAKNKVSQQRTPFWQIVLLPIAAILIFFLLLEGGLALFGVKPALKTEDPFVGFASNVPLFVAGSGPHGSQLLATAPNKLNYFNQQSFPRIKPAGTYRIFSLGGSTTYGRPYNDTTSFSGWLREFLPMADGSKSWEVINTGGISYASYRVAHLMEELVNYQPDLFILYTGHNEFLEERTYSQIKEIPPLIRSTVSLLAKTRTWTAMTGSLKKLGVYPEAKKQNHDQLGGRVDAILDQSAGLNRYTRDDTLQANILKHYRISLERMVSLTRSVGAEIIFVTPASNLKDCTPFKSEHTAGLDQAKKQRSAKLLGQAKLALGRQSWNEALELLEAAIAIDPRQAELHYRRGQGLMGLKRFEAADNAFRQARDQDVCPLRALSPMRQVVLDIADEQGIRVVDYVALLEETTQHNLGLKSPGDELFLDHVHPTIEGHKILAIALLRAMIDQGLVQSGTWGEQEIEAITRKINSKIDQETHGQALANLARVLLWAGKLEDASRLATQAQEKAGEFRQVFVDSASILTSVYLNTGQYNEAVRTMYGTLERAPGAIEIRLKLGETLADRRFMKLEEAAANLLLVCQQMPTYDIAFSNYAAAMAKRGRIAVAYDSANEALRLNPKNTMAQATYNRMRSMLKDQNFRPRQPLVMLDIYPSRAPRKLIQMYRDASGKPVPHGAEVEFYENGRIKHFVDIAHGQWNGLEMTWDENGQLLTRNVYQNDKLVRQEPVN
ncbi:MAG: hypothetical protein QNK27_07355 [Desulfuromusa sp.]|nr:hypothetical protein [Desulfuromusa sp.]